MTPFSGMYPSLADTCATKPTWLLEKEILSKLERDMLQYIDTRSLIPLLKSKGMISQDDEEHINRLGDGCRKQSKYILEIIPKKVNYWIHVYQHNYTYKIIHLHVYIHIIAHDYTWVVYVIHFQRTIRFPVHMHEGCAHCVLFATDMP